MIRNYRFKSVEHFLGTATLPCHEDVPGKSDQPGNVDFRGTASFDEAVNLARHGWPEGAKLIRDALAKVKAAMPRDPDLVARFAPSGDEVDIGRFLSGEPECMIEHSYVENEKPIVKLVVSVSRLMTVSGSVIVTRGAAICALIHALEESGSRVEVEVARDSKNGASQLHVRMMLKEAHDPLDIDRLAFCLANPAFQRRLCFRLNEIHGTKEFIALGGGGYGYSIAPEHEAGAFTFDHLADDWDDDRAWTSPDRAAKRVNEIIREIQA